MNVLGQPAAPRSNSNRCRPLDVTASPSPPPLHATPPAPRARSLALPARCPPSKGVSSTEISDANAFFPLCQSLGRLARVDFFLGWSKLKLLSGLRRPSHQQRETTGDCGGGGGGGPSVFIARRRGDRLELSRTEPAHWPTAHTLVGEARGRNRGRAFFLGAARFFFFLATLRVLSRSDRGKTERWSRARLFTV